MSSDNDSISNSDSNNKSSYSFNCTRCGHCCKDEGYVFFTEREVFLASRALGMKKEDFIASYLKKEMFMDEYFHYVKKNSACVFLVDNLCTIQDAKPKQCSTFPYWDEYMDENRNISNEKFNRKCPGMKFL